jgi:hypothetical protein
MRPAVKSIPQTDTRTITSSEVMEWFGRKPLSDEACTEIAARLTKMRWASDLLLPVLEDGMRWTLAAVPPGEADWLHLPAGKMTWEQTPDNDPDPYWDIQAATEAAKTLLASIPRMLRHWDEQRLTPRASSEAIKALDDALERALPFIESPFGQGERQDHRERMRLKDWQMPALAIKNIMSQVLSKCGRQSAFSRAAAATRVVKRALVRMGYKIPHRKGEYSETNTLAAFFRRWEKHWVKTGHTETTFSV